MDKSWIKIHDRTNPVFLEGLKNFMEYLKNYLDKEGKTKCPCKNCCNCNSYTPATVYAHIHVYGFQQFYTTWVYHGERYPSTSASRKLASSDKIKTPVTLATPEINNEMFNVIEDIIAEQDTHEENTEEDGTHVENIEEDGTHDKNPEKDGTGLDPEYDALFEELNVELYPGCTEMSSLNFLAKLMHIKVINKWTNSSFDQLLKLLRVVFPKDNRVPTSHYEAKKKLKTIGLGYKSIHVCKYDCALFWKENEDEENCPVCKESRWVDKNTKGKKVPHKVLRYFPLTPRLRRLYSSRNTAKEMVWHNTGRSTDDLMRHPVDGKEWHEFDERYPVFASEPRNVRLGLAADGFNPFGNMSLTYSMWPVVLTTYNTPPWLCMKESSFMLTLLIPGPKSPGKDLDVFLRPLVDELDMLWKKGVLTRDGATNTIFRMHAALLWTINDYPARSSLSGWSGQGYKASPTCNVDTPSCRVTSKIAFVGHRRFLRKNNRMRGDLSFNGKKETANPPRRLNNEGTYRFVGQYSSMFTRCISNEIDKKIPYHYSCWSAIPGHLRLHIFETLSNFFDLAPLEARDDWCDIETQILRDCARRYAGRKHKLAVHFRSNGGGDSPDRAKKNPPKGYDVEEWKKLIDNLFNTPAWLAQSAANIQNRKKVPFGSLCGTESYAQKRFVKGTEDDQPNAIMVWYETHYRGDWEDRGFDGFENVVALQTWHNIRNEHDRQVEVGPDGQVDELDLLRRVLGETPVYIRGVGRKRSASSSFGVNSSQQRSQLQQQAELIEQLQQQAAEMDARILDVQRQMEKKMKKTNEETRKTVQETNEETNEDMVPRVT